MLRNRLESVERTRTRLHYALDRFQLGTLQTLPQGTSLTIRSLAVEAEVNKDTIISRNAANHRRYEEIIKRLRELQEKLRRPRVQQRARRDDTIERLHRKIDELNELNVMQARMIDELDSKVQELERDKRQLEENIRAEPNKIIMYQNSRSKGENR